jgi:predicted MFS family arabinose efflux permease
MKSRIALFAGILAGFICLASLLLMFTQKQNTIIIVLMLFGISVFTLLNLLLSESARRKRSDTDRIASSPDKI